MCNIITSIKMASCLSQPTIYVLTDFERIKREGFHYVLPEETLRNIKTIATNVGAPEYIKTPHFEKRQHSSHQHHNKHRANTKEISDIEWDTLRNFKATVMEKKKGVELSIDKIRKHLNKMTDKTYENLKAQIIAEIDTILVDEVNVGELNVDEVNVGEVNVGEVNEEIITELNRIGDAVFEIASGNSFYSKMYATLYKELMNKYAFMKTILEQRIVSDTDCSFIKNFEYSDPNKDYDQFCKNNKTNEKRRALGLFYVNMMLMKIIPVTKIVSMIEELQTDMLNFIKKENNVNIVEEISELLFILITNSVNQMNTSEEWQHIVERVHFVSGMKPKAEPSISNKTIFKHMDIKTFVDKNTH